MANRFRRIALVNPRWSFEGSCYWACQETHLPLELLYSSALLRQAGFTSLVVDAHLEDLGEDSMAERIVDFDPDLIVVTTAPSYLFWRCPPPELDVPRAACTAMRGIAPIVAIGPHGSATPGYAFDQLGCQAVIRGEPETELVQIARGTPGAATLWRGEGDPTEDVALAASSLPIAIVDVTELPELDYADYPLERRSHRHHVFWGEGRGAEVEFSRGCPYGCSFCARHFFRGRYRERPVERVLAELRRLRSRGIDYVYFIDEVFGLGGCEALLRALGEQRIVQFGCQTRIDLWDEARLDRLAAAGCISIEFGLESPFPEVQGALNKGYRIDGDRILELMVHAKARIPWVQGDLIDPPGPDPILKQRLEEWRQRAIGRGVWVSEPVGMFLYPGCDLHEETIGPLDGDSWNRARARYRPCGC